MARNMLRALIAPVALLGLGSAPAARADFVFFTSNGDFQSGLNANGLTDQNVLFNGTGTTNGPALTVIGRTNQTDSLVNVTGVQNLVAEASGQAKVSAETGTFTTAAITPNGYPAFRSLSLNVNPAEQTGGTVRLTVTNQFGVTGFEDIDVTPGLVFLGVIATNGQVITDATVSATGNSISDIRQIRVTPVPEPASLAALGIGVGAVGLFGGLRRRARSARA